MVKNQTKPGTWKLFFEAQTIIYQNEPYIRNKVINNSGQITVQ